MSLDDAAVGLDFKDAFKVYELHRLEAAASPKNLGSRFALPKNGFQLWGRARRSYLLNGVREDNVLFERVADEA